MKRFAILILALAAFSCSAPKTTVSKGLYEVLTRQQEGGATIRFYEILTEEKEIAMLRSDASLAQKIRPEDISRANFVILNLGEKPTAGYTIEVTGAQETPDSVILTVKEQAPTGMAAQVISYPYVVVRVNSKKKIEIRD